MNYTTLARVKIALGADASTSDAHLNAIIASVSRAIDRKCAAMVNSDDYFTLATVTGEQGQGRAARNGTIIYPARKVTIQSVSSFEYRFNPRSDWLSVDAQYITHSGYLAKAWRDSIAAGDVLVRMTYSGGLAATPDALPADILDAADVLAVRFFKEIKSGLGDTIGVAELGTLQYTKAWPARVLEMLKPYMRVA